MSAFRLRADAVGHANIPETRSGIICLLFLPGLRAKSSAQLRRCDASNDHTRRTLRESAALRCMLRDYSGGSSPSDIARTGTLLSLGAGSDRLAPLLLWDDLLSGTAAGDMVA
jgi:hypothetical protein